MPDERAQSRDCRAHGLPTEDMLKRRPSPLTREVQACSRRPGIRHDRACSGYRIHYRMTEICKRGDRIARVASQRCGNLRRDSDPIERLSPTIADLYRSLTVVKKGSEVSDPFYL